jgi:hypothetical protein
MGKSYKIYELFKLEYFCYEYVVSVHIIMSYFPIKTREKTVTEDNKSFLYQPRYNKMQNIVKYFLGRLVTNEQLLEAKEGYYTWIYRASGNFYAIKTITKQEVGTLHANLKLLTDSFDSSHIDAAGELELIKEESYAPPTIIFNLLSGTYMAKIFEKLPEKDKLLLRNEKVATIQQVLMNWGIPSQFLECSNIECSEEEKIGGMKLIESGVIKTSSKKLATLNQYFKRVGGRTRKAQRKRYGTAKKTSMKRR